MNSVELFRVNTPHVIHEIIEGEAVLVNLDSGNYYSTDRAGAVVWDLLDGGAVLSQIVDRLAQRYSGERCDIETGVRQLIDHLQREELIVPRQAGDGGGGAVAAGDAVPVPADRPIFEPPTLHKYTDMVDLLLLDPIHEVDETGWPNLPENGTQ